MPLTQLQCSVLAAAAHDLARERGWKITVAVVDEGGFLQLLDRMDGAFPLSTKLAEAKAVGAAMWYRDGQQLADLREARPAFFDVASSMVRVPLVPGDGSVPIRDGDRVIGAVGVSGAAANEDRECAEAGLRAVFGS